MQRWVSAIRKVALPLQPGRLAIFVDEIDAVASLKFSTDEFFAGIRQCYNLRNEDIDINRLTFCLLGVASPADLIRDTRTTPFNVGRRIELNDFTEGEARPLSLGLGGSAAENDALLKKVFYWTSGHPYLTQRLCKAVAEKPASGGNVDIDDAIEQLFFCKRAQEYDDNLIFVRERLLRGGADVTALLNLYSRVRRNKKVVDEESQPLSSILRLSGVTRSVDGVLRVRNRIYKKVFNGEWIKANLPGAEVRRQRAAFRRGVIRTTAVATVILTVMAALAILAFRQRNFARAQTEANKHLLYLARMKLANQEYENANIAWVDQLVTETTPKSGDRDLRSFEWSLFWRYAHLETMRLQEPGRITSAKFFNGDDTIAVAEVDRTMVQQKREYLIKLYKTRPQEATSFIVPAGTTFDIAVFSQDNKYVATDAPDKSVALWDLSSRQQVRKFPGPGSAVTAVVFAPDQHALAAAFDGGIFRVWDLDSGTQRFEGLSELKQPGIAFSPDGKHLAVGMTHYSTDILDVNTGKPLRSFLFPKGPLGLIFFSPDGNRLFATTADGYIFCWNIRVGKLLNFNQTHTDEVMSFSFSPEGRRLATSSVDRTVKLWDVANGTELRTILGHGAWVGSVHWSANGRYLLSGDRDGLIKMWDMEATEPPIWPANKALSVSALTFSPKNELIAIGRALDGKLRLWDLSNGRNDSYPGPDGKITSAAFSKDAAQLAVAIGPQIWIYRFGISPYGIGWRPISTVEAPAAEIYSLEFSPDGTKLLSGDHHGNVILSDVASGRQEERLESGNTYYRAVFSPDGKLIASADQDGKVRIWDVASSTIKNTLSGHIGIVRLIRVSPNGQLLATAGEDNTVRIWDLSSGKELNWAQFDFVERLEFSPDGKRLVTASYDGAVVLWDLDGMQEVITLRKRGAQRPSSLSFSPDGLSLAVSYEDGEVKVWQGGKPGF